ncbi:hypothetical protein GCM10022290_00010 [Sagittula marina]
MRVVWGSRKSPFTGGAEALRDGPDGADEALRGDTEAKRG